MTISTAEFLERLWQFVRREADAQYRALEERESLIRDNSRKLYMAATRAGQRLVLTYSGELPEVLEKALNG